MAFTSTLGGLSERKGDSPRTCADFRLLTPFHYSHSDGLGVYFVEPFFISLCTLSSSTNLLLALGRSLHIRLLIFE